MTEPDVIRLYAKQLRLPTLALYLDVVRQAEEMGWGAMMIFFARFYVESLNNGKKIKENGEFVRLDLPWIKVWTCLILPVYLM